MSLFAVYETLSGRIVQTCRARDVEAARACCQDGQDVTPAESDVDDVNFYVQDAGAVTMPLQPQVVPMPERPSEHHLFDFATKQWADPRTLAIVKVELTAAATSRRWAVETGGIELQGGIRVGTEKADQDRVTSVIVNATTAGVESVDFKAKSGWVTLTVAQVQGIASAIARHVQACFTAERAHHEAIAALPSFEAALEYDVQAGWPG